MLRAGVLVALLASTTLPGVNPMARAAAAAIDRLDVDDAAALLAARDRSARAEATLDSLKRAMVPGHLLDPMPDLDHAVGLETLRGDYAEMQRKAAGYRATLGDHHPTLAAAEQVLADLRGQLLDRTRTALAAAERDAAQARADVSAVERRRAARAASVAAGLAQDRSADVTGSLPPVLRPHVSAPTALPGSAAADIAAIKVAVTAMADGPETVPPVVSPVSRRALGAALAAAAAVLAGLAVLVAAFLLVRRRTPRMVSLAGRRDVETGSVVDPAPPDPRLSEDASPSAGLNTPGPSEAGRRGARPAPTDAVPVLARMALPASADPVALVEDLAAARDLHGTLREAFDGPARDRMTVLMAAVAGLPEADADAAALALALAAAAAGRCVLLLEARVSGRLRRSLVPGEAAPLLIEAGGTVRTLYRLEVEGLTVAVLPSDPGEAEAATAAATRTGTVRLQGLSAFDTVLLLGDDAAALAHGADIILVTAPAEASAADLTAAARRLGAAGRPCGALLVRRAAGAVVPRQAARPEPRLRSRPEVTQAAARLGLRGSFATAGRVA